MKFIVMLLLNLCGFVASFGQNCLDGSYSTDMSVETVKIEGDRFYYIINQGDHMVVYYTDTLAKCRIVGRYGEFIELNSGDLIQRGREGMTVMQVYNPGIPADSIEVCFDLPLSEAVIEVSFNSHTMYQTLSIDYPSRVSIRIPKDLYESRFSFLIRPSRLPLFSLEGVLHSPLCYDPYVRIEVSPQRNQVTIRMPAIDDVFFEREHVVGEYARISGDTLFWRGEVFLKKKIRD